MNSWPCYARSGKNSRVNCILIVTWKMFLDLLETLMLKSAKGQGTLITTAMVAVLALMCVPLTDTMNLTKE